MPSENYILLSKFDSLVHSRNSKFDSLVQENSWRQTKHSNKQTKLLTNHKHTSTIANRFSSLKQDYLILLIFVKPRSLTEKRSGYVTRAGVPNLVYMYPQWFIYCTAAEINFEKCKHSLPSYF